LSTIDLFIFISVEFDICSFFSMSLKSDTLILFNVTSSFFDISLLLLSVALLSVFFFFLLLLLNTPQYIGFPHFENL